MPLIQHGRPDLNLLTLCRKCGVNVTDDVSPTALNDQLQEIWFKAGYLRYQIKGEPPSDEDWELLRKLGFIDEVAPPASTYFAGFLVLGALRSRVVSRLHYLTQFTEPLTVRTVFLLGGARPLDPVKESREVLCTPGGLPFKEGWVLPDVMPTTEAGMMKLVVEQSVLPERRDLVYHVVDAALQLKEPSQVEGEKQPPNTADTVCTLFKPEFRQQTGGTIWRYEDTWVRYNQLPTLPCSTYLAVSNQPFVEYQRLAVQRVVPSSCRVVACGPAASPTLPLATFLDNIAKQLFEELREPSHS